MLIFFLYRRRYRVVGLTIERTFFLEVILNRLGGLVTTQGRSLAAREFRERSKNDEKYDFLEAQNGENAVFARNIENLMELDRGKMGTYQIDPRGSHAAIAFACSVI